MHSDTSRWRSVGYLSSLLVLVGVVSISSACVYRTLSMTADGYRFDRSGTRRDGANQGAFSVAISELSVENRNGKVLVEALAEDQPASWEWTFSVWGETPEVAEALLAEVMLAGEETESRGLLRLKLPEDRKSDLRGLESNITLRVPASLAIKIRNRFGPTEVRGLIFSTHIKAAHGAIDAEDLSGAVFLETSFASLTARRIHNATVRNAHGAIHIVGVDGDLDARTTFAPLEAEDVSGNLTARNEHGEIKVSRVGGDADLETSFNGIVALEIAGDAKLNGEHGSIQGARLHGRTTARNSFGDVTLESDGSELTCRNEHGDVAIELMRADFQMVKADTKFGSIKVALPPHAEPAIAARASFGRVRSALPYLERNESGLTGKPLLELAVEHGDIRISKN
ncbi:MAG: hypothetical protein ACKVX7_06900 [Planctomycetota bacterium]